MLREYISTISIVKEALDKSGLSADKKLKLLQELIYDIEFERGKVVCAELFGTCEYSIEECPGVRMNPDPADFSLCMAEEIGKFSLSYKSATIYDVDFDENGQPGEPYINWDIIFELIYPKNYDMRTLIEHLCRDKFDHLVPLPTLPAFVDRTRDPYARPTLVNINTVSNYSRFCRALIDEYEFNFGYHKDLNKLNDFVHMRGFDRLVENLQRYGYRVQEEILAAVREKNAANQADRDDSLRDYVPGA
jgi:hypothetical protein